MAKKSSSSLRTYASKSVVMYAEGTYNMYGKVPLLPALRAGTDIA